MVSASEFRSTEFLGMGYSVIIIVKSSQVKQKVIRRKQQKSYLLKEMSWQVKQKVTQLMEKKSQLVKQKERSNYQEHFRKNLISILWRHCWSHCLEKINYMFLRNYNVWLIMKKQLKHRGRPSAILKVKLKTPWMKFIF